jgi:serine/threonine-protein kinase
VGFEEEAQQSPLVPGYRLDRYELLCPVGEGGMASVWVARLTRKYGFEKLVAVKTILQKHAADDRFRKMFLDEARIASRITHPNVAQILDLGEENDVLYLVMEWVDGDALSRLQRTLARKEAEFPVPIALRIVSDICAGLHAAHELAGPDGTPLGVVHRDVSSQNILVSSTGVAKLIDFGIAKARDRVAAQTSAGFFKGKIHYMAPEQAVGREVDRRADVWALGAVLYYILAGRPAYDGENQLATLHALGSGRPPDPLPDRVPARVREVIFRALAHDVEARFPTTAQLRDALERVMIDEHVVGTANDVAAFVRHQLPAQAAARKKAIDAAISAANDREKLARAIEPASTESTPGARVRPQAPRSSPNAISLTPDAPSSPGSIQGSMSSSIVGVPVVDRYRIAVLAVLGVLAVIGLVLIIVALRGSSAAKTTPVAASALAKTAETPPPPATETTPPPPTETTQPTPAATPTTSAIAKAAPRTAAPPPPKHGALRSPPPPPPAQPTTGKKRIDDGF